MRPAVHILAFFAALWSCLGIWAGGHGSLPAYAAPVAFSIALVFWATRRPDGSKLAPSERSRIGKVVAIASAAEGVAIGVAVFVLANVGYGDFTVDAIAVIVGLHFIPLAHYLERPLYYGTAAMMTAAGLGGIWLAADTRAVFVCMMSACILWSTLILVARNAHAPSTAGALQATPRGVE